MSTIEIDNIAGIPALKIEVPPSGVVVVTGQCGSGKTRTLDAIAGLLHQGESRPVPAEGTAGVRVEGFGARFTVGRKASHSGELAVSHLEGIDPSLFVDPGIKDQAAADGARIRALLRLARASVDVSAFAELLGSEDELRELCRPASLNETDAPAMASSIKRDLEAAARKAESEAKNLATLAAGKLAALRDLAGDLDATELPSAADARTEHEAAIRELSAAEGARKSADALIAAGDAARQALERLGSQGTSDQLELYEQSLAQGAVEGESLRAQLTDLQRRIEMHERVMESARRELRAQREAARQRESLERAIAAADSAMPTSDEALEMLRAIADEARSLSEAAATAERTAQMRADAEELQRRADLAGIRSAQLRQAAAGTETVLLDAVREVCGDSLQIRGGRIYYRHAGRNAWVPIEELSTGERWDLALEIGARAVGERGVLVCRQEGWQALDPARKAGVIAKLHELGAVMFAGQVAEGELRVEVIQ